MIDYIENTLFEFVIGIFGNFNLEFTGFKVSTRKQTYKVCKFCSWVHVHKGNTENIIAFRVKYIFLIVFEPSQFRHIFGIGKLFIVFFYVLVERRFYTQVSKVVNCFTEHIAAIGFVGSNLGHNEVTLTQCSTLGVDTDEDIGNDINIKGLGQFNYTDKTVSDRAKVGKDFVQSFGFHLWIIFAILSDKGEYREVILEDFGNIRYPLFASQMALVLHGEDFSVFIFGECFKRIESNLNSFFFIVGIDYRNTCDSSHQCSNSLLTVNKDFLTSRNTAVLQFDIRVLPNDKITRRVTLV